VGSTKHAQHYWLCLARERRYSGSHHEQRHQEILPDGTRRTFNFLCHLMIAEAPIDLSVIHSPASSTSSRGQCWRIPSIVDLKRWPYDNTSCSRRGSLVITLSKQGSGKHQPAVTYNLLSEGALHA
jgi:hypothetical protein